MSSPDGRARGRPQGIPAPRFGMSPTRTSPRIPRNPYATASSGLQKKGPVGAVTSAVTSGGTTAVARGGGAPPQHENAFPPPSRTLSFATPQAEFANRSVSSLSWSTRTPSTKTSVEKRNLSVDSSNKFSEPRKKQKQTGGEDFDVSFEADVLDKDDKDMDFFPTTDKAMDAVIQGKGSWETDGILKGIKMRHRQAFMDKAFPPQKETTYANAQVKSACMKTCRPQSDIDYIIYVITHWQKGTEAKSLPPGPERDRLISFCSNNRCGNKYIHQYFTDEVFAPGDTAPRTVLRKYNKDGSEGRIVVSREQLFDAIDEWHEHSGHLGQERTWKFCRSKDANVTQDHVKFYCQTCFACMKKNPVTKTEKGSRKPIFSKNFQDRFQIDLTDFRKLRKRDPFGVLMRWVMTLKDHATGLIHICALPRKRPDLIAYKLQEIFGLIGYPKIFHTDNGKEFTAKLILQFLRQLNPNIVAVTGRPRRPQDQGSVENANATLKRVLSSVLTERRLAGENPNWTEVLGSVAAVLNSQSGRGRNDVSAYEAVFGQVYDHPLTCSKEEARRCWTIDERIRVTSEPYFEDYVRDTYHIREGTQDEDQDNEDLKDIGYWSSDDLPLEEADEVTDSYFYENLWKSSQEEQTFDYDLKSPPEDLKSPPEDLKSPPEDVESSDDRVESPPGFVESTETDGDLFQDVHELEDVVSPTTFSPVEECFETGLIFGPNCVDRCFIHNIFSSFHEKKCAHTWQSVNLSRTGEFVSFPSSFFHRGYFKMKENQIVVTAQLFASDNGSSPNHPSRHLASKNSMDAVNNGMLTIDLTRLSEDVLLRWDVNYPISEFAPCKSFGGVWINTESNRQIHKSKFARVPYIARLVKAFEEKYHSLSIDQVWLIRKSHSELGFQRWHQDLPKLEGERAIVKSIVVNIGQMTARFPEDDGSTLLVEDNKPSDENSTDSSY